MYIMLSWFPFNGVPDADVLIDINDALLPSDFPITHQPFVRCKIARVARGNTVLVDNLWERLFMLSTVRFEFLISYIPSGHLMRISSGVDEATCTTISR